MGAHMPSEKKGNKKGGGKSNAMLKKAVKDGKITQKQLDKMPEKMLIGLVKKGGNGAKKKK
tara:strand:- start:170 stop:352 length:183 start_codon:yes stop_codon:yes gene_type:complete